MALNIYQHCFSLQAVHLLLVSCKHASRASTLTQRAIHFPNCPTVLQLLLSDVHHVNSQTNYVHQPTCLFYGNAVDSFTGQSREGVQTSGQSKYFTAMFHLHVCYQGLCKTRGPFPYMCLLGLTRLRFASPLQQGYWLEGVFLIDDTLVMSQ